MSTRSSVPDADSRGRSDRDLTLAWNVVGIVVLAIAAVTARSVALAGFGLDSLIEIGASAVVIWELSGIGEERQRRGLRLIGCAFAALAVYLLVQSTGVLVTGYHPRHSSLGIAWTAVTAVAMFALAAAKARTGRALRNPVLRTEGRVTMIDGILAAAVLLGLTLNAGLRWWWADPAAGYVLVYYAAREIREIFLADHLLTALVIRRLGETDPQLLSNADEVRHEADEFLDHMVGRQVCPRPAHGACSLPQGSSLRIGPGRVDHGKQP